MKPTPRIQLLELLPSEAAHTGNDRAMSIKVSDYSWVPCARTPHKLPEHINVSGRRVFERSQGICFPALAAWLQDASPLERPISVAEGKKRSKGKKPQVAFP
jgi:hypothetical protein